MKTKVISLLIIFCSFTQITKAQNAFNVGEDLEYNMFYNWGFVWLNAARVNFQVKTATFQQKPVYKFEMTGETIKAFSLFYFKDTTYTYADQQTLLPYFAYQGSHESDYFSIDRYSFFPDEDPSNWRVILNRQTKKNTSRDTITGNKFYFDLLSTLYRLRNTDVSSFQPDQKLPMPMVFNDGTYDLYLRYVGKEQIKLKNGKTYNCLIIKPLLAEGKMFEKGEGMTIWISDDKNHIPMMIESKLKVGSIKAQIVTIKNTAYPMTSEVKKK